MVRNHQNKDDGDENENNEEPKENWNLTPQTITAIVSILGMLGATFWTLSDFRITLANIDQRLIIQSQRMTEYEKRLDDFDRNGTRGSSATDFTVKSLQKQIDDLREKTQDMDRALIQHNESMMELYKKDLSDGKRDFRVTR